MANPKHANAYSNRAVAHYYGGQYCIAYCNRGLVYVKTDKFDAAIADYTVAIRLNPKDHRGYYRRGLAYQKKGGQAKAEADFAKAKELGYKPE